MKPIILRSLLIVATQYACLCMYVHTYLHTCTYRIESNARDCGSGVWECRALVLKCMALLLTCMALLPNPLMHSCRNGLLSNRHSSDRFSYLSGHGQRAVPHSPCPFNSNPPSSIPYELFRLARQCLRSVFFFLTHVTILITIVFVCHRLPFCFLN